MSLADMIKKKDYKPPVIVIYGEAGAGKTTLGTTFPSPIFLNLEGSGLRAYDVPEIPVRTVADYEAAVNALKTEFHEYKTIVVDTLDRLEEYATADVCAQMNLKDINKAPYGEGYFKRARLVNLLIDATIDLGIVPVFLAHSYVSTVSAPDVAADYHYRDIKLWRSKSGGVDSYNHLIELADMIGYITTEILPDNGRAMAMGGRKVLVKYSPAHQSKIRLQNAPDSIECDGKKILALLDREMEGDTKKA